MVAHDLTFVGNAMSKNGTDLAMELKSSQINESFNFQVKATSYAQFIHIL